MSEKTETAVPQLELDASNSDMPATSNKQLTKLKLE